MKDLRDSATSPNNDDRLDDYERERLAYTVKTRRAWSGIPKLYANADIGRCPDAVRAYAAGFGGEGTVGLVMYGNVGTGKTYAACALLDSLFPKTWGLFTTVGGILGEIYATYGGQGDELQVISRYVSCPVLVVDDLGKERVSEKALEVIFRIVDGRVNRMLPTIVTTQYEPVELARRLSSGGDEDIAEAIVSRLATCRWVAFEGPDRRCPDGA